MRTAIFISKCTNPWLNLALEEWLFLGHRNKPESPLLSLLSNKVDQGQYQLPMYSLFLWRNTPSLFMGRNQNPWREVNVSLAKRQGVPIIRRQSGGGTVYHDLGNTNYTVIMPREKFDRHTHAGMVKRALHALDIPAAVNQRHDLTLHDRKISGSAYKLVNDCAYHHGTLLIDADLEGLKVLLKPPHRNIMGRGVESVPSPVTTCRSVSYTIDHSTFSEALMQEFQNTYPPSAGHDIISIDETWIQGNEEICSRADVFRSDSWTFAQTPPFTHSFACQLPDHDGSVAVEMIIEQGLFSQVKIKGPPSFDLFFTGLESLLIGRPYDIKEVQLGLHGFNSNKMLSKLLEKFEEEIP